MMPTKLFAPLKSPTFNKDQINRLPPTPSGKDKTNSRPVVELADVDSYVNKAMKAAGPKYEKQKEEKDIVVSKSY